MAYKIEMTDTKAGQTKLIDFENDWADGSLFCWTLGNFRCDCNRFDFFYPKTESERECGEGRFFVSKAILPNGEEIIIDTGEKE